MAVVLPETTRTSFAETYIMNLESTFDLDTVLTGADNYNDKTVTAPLSMVIAKFPAVAVVDDICAVCREDFRLDEGGKMIPCGHVYHENCIASWLSVADRCPLCRRQISTGENKEAPKIE